MQQQQQQEFDELQVGVEAGKLAVRREEECSQYSADCKVDTVVEMSVEAVVVLVEAEMVAGDLSTFSSIL